MGRTASVLAARRAPAFVAVGACVVTWFIVAPHLPHPGLWPDIVIVSVAVFKVRLVGLYFLELRVAPLYLRCIFESYCVILFCLLTALYLMAG